MENSNFEWHKKWGSLHTGGSATVNFSGSVNDSIIASGVTVGQGYVPKITINKTAGTLTFIGNISTYSNWTNNYSQANINPGASTLYINGYYGLTIGGTYPTPTWNVELYSYEGIITLSEDSALIVKNNLTLTGTYQTPTNGYTINIYGNIIINNTGTGDEGGSTVFSLLGSANDTIKASSGVALGEGYLPNIQISKTGGNLYLIGDISLSGNWTNNYSQNNINPGTSTLYINSYYGLTIGGTYPTPAWNVELYSYEDAITLSEDSALIVKNNLTLTGSYETPTYEHTINIYGNIIINNTGIGDEGSTVFNLVSSLNDTIKASSGVALGEGNLPNIQISKTGGNLYLIGNISVSGNWTNNFSQNNIFPGTSTLFFNAGGNITIGGTYNTPVWNASFYSSENDFTFNNDSALIVKNNLTITGSHYFYMYNHAIPIYGNIIANNTADGVHSSTTTFNIVGSNNDTINSPSGYTLGECYLPNIYINKTGGTLFLAGNITLGGSWSYNQGTVNAGTSTVGNYNGGTLSCVSGSNVMSFNNLTIGSNTTLAGAINMGSNLTINSSQTLHTSASNYPVNIGGNWINNGTYDGNSSTITFDGSGGNYIEGSSNSTFYSLTINQSGNLALSDPTTVTNALTLTSGDILTTSTDLLTLNNGSSVSGGSDNSFVNGPIKKIGNSAFTFPTGANSSYHPIGITAPSSTSDAFEAQYAYSPPAGRTYTDDSLTYVSTCDYWLLSHPAGSSSTTVSLFWGTGSCNIDRLSSLRVGYYNTTTHDWTNLGQSASTGTTTSGSVTATTSLSISATADTFAISKHSPTPTANAGSGVSICYGSSTTLTGSATGGFSPYTYSWSPSTGLSATTGSTVTASPTATTTYTVTVEDDDNAPTATATVVVTVNPLPTVTASASPSSICYNSSSTLIAGGAVTYTWSPSTGLSVTSGSSVTATLTATTTYTVTGIDANECMNTATSNITVNPQLIINAGDDTAVWQSPSNYVLLGGRPSAIGGTPPYNYLWSPSIFLDDSTIANPLATITEADTITYILTVTDSNGCNQNSQITVRATGSNPYHLTITDLNNGNSCIGGYNSDDPTVSPSSMGCGCTLLACPGDELRITFNNCGDTAGTNLYYITNDGYYHYHNIGYFTFGSGNYFDFNSSGFTLGQEYTLVTDEIENMCDPYDRIQDGDEAVYSVCFEFDNEINCNAGSPVTIDEGNSTTLNSTVSGGTGAGTYTYSWEPASSLNCLTCSNPIATPTATTTYTLTVTDEDGCTCTSAVVVTVNCDLSSSAGSDFSICSGMRGQLIGKGIGGVPGYTYSWNPSSELHGANTADPYFTLTTTSEEDITFTLTVTDSYGCQSTSTVDVTVLPLPSISVTASPTSICPGSCSTLTASGIYEGEGFYDGSYSWSPLTNLTVTGFNTASVCPTVTTTYTVKGTVTNGCSNTATAVVTVSTTCLACNIENTSVNDCNGNGVIGCEPSGGTGSYSYTWEPAAGLGCSTCQTTTANPSVTTTYTLTVSDGENTCTSQVVVNVLTYGSELSCDAGSAIDIDPGSCVPIDASMSGGTGTYTYTWSPSTGLSSADILSPIACPNEPITDYTLTVNDGCNTSSCSVSVSLNCPFTLECLQFDAMNVSELNSAINTCYPGEYPDNGLYDFPYTIVFYGNLTIDEDFTFDDDDIEFGPGAQVVYASTSSPLTLTLEDNNVFTGNLCGYMWGGIVLNSSYDNLTVSGGSEIDYATTAVTVGSEGVYNITNSYFYNDYIGLSVQYCDYSEPSANFSGNTFNCTTHLFDPYDGQITYHPIEIISSGNVQIGDPSGTANTINSYTAAGIYIENKDGIVPSDPINIYNNVIDPTTTVSPIIYPPVAGEPVGIYANNKYSSFIIGPTPMQTLNIGGITFGKYNRINNNAYGIYITSSIGNLTRPNIRENKMYNNTQTSIYVINSTYPSIGYNLIYPNFNAMYGIYAGNNTGLTQIDSNQVYNTAGDLSNSTIGIYDTKTSPNSSATTNILENTVKNFTTGISVNNEYMPQIGEVCSTCGSPTNNYLPYDILELSGSTAIGISAIGCTNPYIIGNIVDCIECSTNSSLSDNNGVTGIYVEGGGLSTQAYVCSNSTSNLYQGIAVSGEAPESKIKLNDFDNDYYGFYLENTGVVSSQGKDNTTGKSNGVPSDNTWETNNEDLYTTTATKGKFSTFYVRNYAPYDPTSATSTIDDATVIPVTTFSSSQYTSGASCSNTLGFGPRSVDNADTTSDTSAATEDAIIIISDSLNYGSYAGENNWMAKNSLLRAIVSDSTTIDLSDSTVAEFMDTIRTKPMGQLWIIDSLRNNIATVDTTTDTVTIDTAIVNMAAIINNSIIPSIDIESYQQQVNCVYFSTVAMGVDTFNAAQLAILQTIAPLCPLFYGTPVYEARAMLQLEYDTLTFNYSACYDTDEEEVMKKKITESVATTANSADNLQLYPNPANSTVYLVYNQMEPSTQFNLYDVTGKLVLTTTLTKGNYTMLLNLQELSPGIYLYSWNGNTGIINHGKLAVVR